MAWQHHEKMLIPIQLGTLLAHPKWTKSLNSYTITPKPSQLLSPFLQGSSRRSVIQIPPIQQCPWKLWYKPQNFWPRVIFKPELYLQTSLPLSSFTMERFQTALRIKKLADTWCLLPKMNATGNMVSLQSFFSKLSGANLFLKSQHCSFLNGKFSLLYLQKKHDAYDMVDAQKYLLKGEMDIANLLLTMQCEHITHPPQKEIRVWSVHSIQLIYTGHLIRGWHSAKY